MTRYAFNTVMIGLPPARGAGNPVFPWVPAYPYVYVYLILTDRDVSCDWVVVCGIDSPGACRKMIAEARALQCDLNLGVVYDPVRQCHSLRRCQL